MLPVPLTMTLYWLTCPPCVSSGFALGIQEGAPIDYKMNRSILFPFYDPGRCICHSSPGNTLLGYHGHCIWGLILENIGWMLSPSLPGEVLAWHYTPRETAAAPLNTLATGSPLGRFSCLVKAAAKRLTPSFQNRASPSAPHFIPAFL